MTLKQLLKLVTAELKGKLTIDDIYIYWRDIQNKIKLMVRENQTNFYSTSETSLTGSDYSQNEKYIIFTTTGSDKEIHKVRLRKTNGTDETQILDGFVFDSIEEMREYPDLAFVPVTDGTTLTLYTNLSVSNSSWTIDIYYIDDISESDTVDELIQEMFRHYVKSKFDESGIEYKQYINSVNRFALKLTTRPFRFR